jgi:integrase
MKDLPVKFWKKRGYFVINAARVGLTVNHGKFETEYDAKKEAEILKAKFLLNVDVIASEKPKLFSVADAIDDYLQNQKLLMTNSYYKAQKANLDLLKGVVFDDIVVERHQIARVGNKADRVAFRTCIQLAIENEGKSVDTMHTRRKHWQKFFAHAEQAGWIDVNPIAKLKLPKKKPTDSRAPKVQKGFTEWLQTDGLAAYSKAYSKAAETVLASGRKKFKKRNSLTIPPARLELMMLLSMTTGIRQGELRALRRCDYFSNRQMIITRHAIAHGTTALGDVKTETGQDREIEVPSEVCAMLNDYLSKSKFQEFDDLIFPSSIGTPLRKNDFSEACKPIRDACPFIDEDTGKKLEFTWGDLRHAFASNLIHHLGANWAEVAESMGHTNANFTRKQYGHYIVDEEKSQRKRQAAGGILVKKEGRL